MKIIEFNNIDFTYQGSSYRALENINFCVESSEFVVLCGKSGCGKSTLLRLLKKNMAPNGKLYGRILYKGQKIEDITKSVCAAEIGFVQQNPDNQIITDKVWHELAFGLESLGVDNHAIKRRVAEMASFFGIQTWFRKSINELSGGRKQILNLASVMVMKPKVLILDEPTSQLDPIAASEFIGALRKINTELGTTIIISEHRLEELFPMADRVLVMDEGKLIINDNPQNVISSIQSGKCMEMFYGLPAVVKIACESGVYEHCPLTVKDGRNWLFKNIGEPKTQVRQESDLYISQKSLLKTNKVYDETPVISMKDVTFSYEKNKDDVLRHLNLNVKKGELFAVLGGNGVGKTTMLKLLIKALKKDSGNIKIKGKKIEKITDDELFPDILTYLPQNPQALFTENTVYEELVQALYYTKYSDDEKERFVCEMLSEMNLEHLKNSYPYDISGGEQQRLALGMLLLLKPEILLLDEPTKGIDPYFKRALGDILNKLTSSGMTILMVTHDIEFAASYASRCALFFDGEIVSIGTPEDFFTGNSFYTTYANRLAGEWFPDSITWEEVALKCKEVMMKTK